jgi:hypothetical protein
VLGNESVVAYEVDVQGHTSGNPSLIFYTQMPNATLTNVVFGGVYNIRVRASTDNVTFGLYSVYAITDAKGWLGWLVGLGCWLVGFVGWF